MKFQIVFVCIAVLFTQNAVHALSLQATESEKETAAFTINGAKYFHRFTAGNLYEYTPKGQEDLNRWTNMMSVVYNRQAKSLQSLKDYASTMVVNYEAANGVIIKKDSYTDLQGNIIEYFIVVHFSRPDFNEVAFARVKMHEGIAIGVVYSYRIYGKEVKKKTDAWLKKYLATVEKTLLEWKEIPKTPPAS